MFTASNLLAVLLATVAAVAVGALWYSPVLFAGAWMRALGKKPEDLGKPAPAIMNAILMNLVSAFTLSAVFQWQNVTTMFDAVVTAQVLAVGLIVSNQLMRDRFAGATAQLSLINAANTVVGYLAMGVVLALMR